MKHLLAILFALLCLSTVATADDVTPILRTPCKVVEVYDGDTVTVEVTIPVRVRLLGVSSPEIRGPEKPQGIIARDHLRTIIESGEACLEVPLDGRTLGDLFTFNRIKGHLKVSGRDVGQWMIDDGQAIESRE